MISASEALARLRAGNRRFVEDATQASAYSAPARRDGLVSGQSPFAIILGCSDSRVPAELVFDHGLGDLFVIRVAGNIVAPSQIGSVEFAAEQFGTPLVVVLGHSRCGAVKATLDKFSQDAEARSPHLSSIVDRIHPGVTSFLSEWQQLTESGGAAASDALMDRAVRANIEASVAQLESGSALLQDRIRQGTLTIVGAQYSLESGEVTIYSDHDSEAG